MKKKNKKKKRNAFTLIELLAVLVIIGILSIGAIKGVQVLIEKSRRDQRVHQENTLIMAAESYLQDNKSEVPKFIGETSDISAQQLKDSNYLKDEIKNSKGETCMVNSYVRVYKESKDDYNYTAYLYCGNDPIIDDNTNVDVPEIVPVFTDSSGNTTPDVYKNVSDAYLKINIKGGSNNNLIVDGYSYIIYAKRNKEDNLNEVYNSGTLSGNGKTTVVVPPIPLKNYIDITSVTEFKVKVIAINNIGGRQEEIIGAGNSDTATYHDNKPPTCSEIKNQAEEGQWINKANVLSENATNVSRSITAVCKDGTGSGCIRDEFTRTWPNTEQQDAEYAYMQVQDNAGNVSVSDKFILSSKVCDLSLNADEVKDNKCRVRVNVDLTTPAINISAYKAGTGLSQANSINIFDGAKTIANNNESEVTISSNQYINLYGGWMNNTNYPNGVLYIANISDNLHLKDWKWETNAAFVEDKQLGKYKEYSLDNPDAASGTFKQLDMSKNDCGTLAETIKFGFTKEGMRKGRLTVTDAADNVTIFYIEANLDRTAPPVPEPIRLKKSDGSTYNPGEWTNSHITASVDSSFKRDNLSNGGKTTLAGFLEFRYLITKPEGTNVSGNSENHIFNNNYQGKNTIYFMGCDKANNCSAKTTTKAVWLDTVAPICTVTLSNPGVNSKGWLGKGESATVKAVCSESKPSTNISSGCYSGGTWRKEFSKTYSTNIITNVAGAIENGKGGDIRDVAGNITHCAANKTVKIDTNPPTCTKSGDNGSWRNKAVTLKWGCSDTGGSSCDPGRSGSSKTYSGSQTVGKVTIGAYTISDNADNAVGCPALSRNVYYDGQSPKCSSSKSNLNSPDGVTITYKCSDPGDPHSGVKSCPGKQTGIKSSQQKTVYDNVGNSTSCNTTVSSKNQYRYKKKNVPATCTPSNGCCGWVKKTSGKCCGYNTKSGTNCDKCGKTWHTASYTSSGSSCRSGYSCNCISMHTNGCGKCKCTKRYYTCNTCTWNTTAKSCANSCTGPKKCVSNARCCGYICGSEWGSWGGSNTGCTRGSRKLYF